MRFIILIVLVSILSQSAFAAQNFLADKLGYELSLSLQKENLWKESWYNTSLSDHCSTQDCYDIKDINRFWQNLKNQAVTADELVDQLFGTGEIGLDSYKHMLPSLYPIKVAILRYQIKKKYSHYNNQVAEKWKNRYVQLALSTIQLINFKQYPELKDYPVILSEFKQQWKNKKFDLKDLSPEERERSASALKSHGQKINAKDANGYYLVNGFYINSQSPYFAIDFARPIPATLVTFAHEIVHIADPYMEEQRIEYAKYFPEVKKVLNRWMGAKSKLVTEALLHRLFFEVGNYKQLVSLISDRKQRLVTLTSLLNKELNLEDNGSIDVTEAELAVIKKWLDSVVRLTISSEYRAHGFSLLIYSILKNQFNLVAPSEQIEGTNHFLDKLIAGDQALAMDLSAYQNQFDNLRVEMIQGIQEELRRGKIVSEEEKKFLNRFNSSLNLLEKTYHQSVLDYAKQLTNKFSRALTSYSESNSTDISDYLPRWVNDPNHISNPFTILSARISIGQALRFRANIDQYVQELIKINSPLVNLKAGILDIHDVSWGELTLIGFNYIDNPFSSVEAPDNFNGDKTNFNELPDSTKKFFSGMMQKAPENVLSQKPVERSEVLRNLMRLRLYKANSLVDDFKYPLADNLMGVRSYYEKLANGNYEREEMTPDRRRDLVASLDDIMGLAQMTRNEYEKLVLLMRNLTALHGATLCGVGSVCSEFSGSGQWKKLATGFGLKSKALLNFMELYRVYQSKDVREIEQDVDNQVRSVLDLLKEPIDKCKKEKSVTYGSRELGANFKVSYLCDKGELYVVRQPGNKTDSMPTLYDSLGRPKTRIFGSRPLLISPLKSEIVGLTGEVIKTGSTKKKKKKSSDESCFLLSCLFR